MRQRHAVMSVGLTLLALSTITLATWRFLCPGPVRLPEQQRLELPAPKGSRPRHLAVVMGANDGTETTDFMVPYGVLQASGELEVVTVSTGPGPVQLHPALTVQLDQTMEEFDAAQPEGADIVIVPALHRADDPEALIWLQKQAESGALIVGICDGVLTLAHAGLLKGRMATGHWYSMDKLSRRFGETTWVRDRRYVIDGRRVTTTGVSASLPVSLALVEAVAGATQADRLAFHLGVSDFSAAHDSQAFGMSFGLAFTAARNRLAFWNHERFEMPIEEGVDEIALALSADAWSRTFRSTVIATHPTKRLVRTRRGLIIEVEKSVTGEADSLPSATEPSAAALDDALQDIAERYGMHTARLVATQLEYVW